MSTEDRRTTEAAPTAADAAPESWRETFANLWSELASTRAEARSQGCLGADSLGWACAVLAGSANLVSAAADQRRADRDFDLIDQREQYLWCAVSALEASAAVWEEFGPAAGARRQHLMRRLEWRLEECDRGVVNAVSSARVTRRSVVKASASAISAIARLRQSDADRAQLLDQIEDGAVELASLAVRAGVGTALEQCTGTDPDPPPELTEELAELAWQAAVVGHEESEDRDAIGLIFLALQKRPRRADLKVLGAPSADRSLRAESLLAMRRFWLGLAGIEMEALRAIECELPSAIPFDRNAGCLHAARLLVETGAVVRWGEFDLDVALEYQRSRLLRAISVYVNGLRAGKSELRRAGRVLEKLLSRALIVVWVIDRRLGLGATTGPKASR